MHEVVLCADGESLRNPMMLGLDGESFDVQPWLRTLSKAADARDYLRKEEGVDEVWVASSDDVDSINLAAALKRDRSEMKVRLIAWCGSGSLRSRAASAGIDEVMGYPEFARRYAEAKRLCQKENPRRRGEACVMRAGTAREERVEIQERERFNSEMEKRDSPDLEIQGRGFPKQQRDFGIVGAGFEDSDAMPDSLPASIEDSLGMPLGAEGEGPSLDVENAAGFDTAHASAFGETGQGNGRQTHVRQGYALCVMSASGGTGKSVVSALSALIAAAHGYKTLLIDADLQFGDAASMFEESLSLPADAVIARPELMEQARMGSGMPLIVSAPERIEQSELYLPQMPGLIDRARESFDVVVVNTGSFWTESHVQIIEVCSNVLFLMDQRPTSVRAVKRALELCARCGIASQPFLFAVNRCSRHALLTSLDVSCALGGVAVAELKEGGGSVAELSSSGMAARLLDDHNDLCVSLNDFLGTLIPDALGLVPRSSVPGGKRGKAKARRKSGKRKGKVA